MNLKIEGSQTVPWASLFWRPCFGVPDINDPPMPLYDSGITYAKGQPRYSNTFWTMTETHNWERTFFSTTGSSDLIILYLNNHWSSKNGYNVLYVSTFPNWMIYYNVLYVPSGHIWMMDMFNWKEFQLIFTKRCFSKDFFFECCMKMKK